MDIASVSYATFELYATAAPRPAARPPAPGARPAEAEPREDRKPPRAGGGFLVDAMTTALRDIGVAAGPGTPPAAAPAAAADRDPAAAPPRALDAAVGEFAAALWQALRGDRGGGEGGAGRRDGGSEGHSEARQDHRGGGGDRGVRAWGMGRAERGYAGFAMRLQVLAIQVERRGDAAAAAPAASPTGAADAAAPSGATATPAALPAPPVVVDAAPLDAAVVATAAGGPPAPLPSEGAATTDAPVIVQPAAAAGDDRIATLVDAFGLLLGSLGAARAPADERAGPAGTLAAFLRSLSQSLQPWSDRGALTITGGFIRISV